MGYSLSLLALKTPDADRSLADLHISRAGQVCEYARQSLSGCALPNGWYLIVANTCDHSNRQAHDPGSTLHELPCRSVFIGRTCDV